MLECGLRAANVGREGTVAMSYNVGRVAMSYGWTEINTEATCTTNSFTSKEKNILINIQIFSTVRSQMW